MVGARVDGAVAELAEHGVRLVAVLERERRADGDRQVSADDAPAAEEAARDVEQVHRAAAAVGDAGLLAEQLAHDGGRRAADGQRGAVVAVAREQAVALLEGVDRADGRGLLADRKVAVAADPGPGVLLLGALLETADQGHRPEQPAGGAGVLQNAFLTLGSARHRAEPYSGKRLRSALMATPVTVPRLGSDMRSGVLIRFLVDEGDRVRRGDPIYELDTDKVTQEVEAEAEGVLLRIDATDGAEVEVGATLAWIGEPGEAPPSPA